MGIMKYLSIILASEMQPSAQSVLGSRLGSVTTCNDIPFSLPVNGHDICFWMKK